LFTFLHAADLHLDSPLSGLERYEGAPVEKIRGATRQALENLVNLAIDRRVQFVLLAGDQYDGDHDDYRTILYFTRQMARLQEAGIRVYTIAGNHDAASRMTKSLRLPENVKLLSTRHPETIRYDEPGVAIHGRGFAKPAESDNLALGYPAAIPGCFNIGLLHTSLDGREGHDRYAPCTLAELRQKGYEYWALGHVHQREVVLAGESHVVFPGNVQGRHIRERGAKGCYIIAVDDRLQAKLEFVPLDVFRWELCEVSAAGAKQPDEVIDRVSQRLAELLAANAGWPLGVRVIVQGQSAADATLRSDGEKWSQEIRAAAIRLDAERLWLEKIAFRTTPPAAAANLDGPLGELRAYLSELRSDDAQLAELGRELNDLRRKLPAETLSGEPVLPSHSEWLRLVLDDVGPLLEQQLSGQEADA
jgi:DNA repair exonuclease SbcCD nuclease subunit